MRYSIFTIAIGLFFASCSNYQCTNVNPIFEQYNPADREYKAELARVVTLANKDSLAAWIHAYKVVKGREYMYVNMIGRGICAVAIMDITNNTELAAYRSAKGESYNGAFLPHLKYHIEHTDKGYNFVLDKVGEILE